MRIDQLVLQLSGIDLADIREERIKDAVRRSCAEQGVDADSAESVKIYLNIEGTAVTAYYVVDALRGSVVLNRNGTG
ncbi:MAG: hypothetical protein Q4A52_08070 [Bacillota bacterium]|nr:hypothetical protein [Bacillota bacterium]